MIDLGTVKPGSILRIPWSTFDKDDGSSITVTSYTVGDILIYKDGSTTERASTSGYTATTDFDAKTGKQLAIIDLADNTTAGFFSAGSEYIIAIDAVTVDTVTTGGWIARFRIGYPGAVLDTTISVLGASTSQTVFNLTNGPPEDDALNGMWAIVHDVAHAYQCAYVVIQDYYGGDKTVVLAANPVFSIAATDNFSVIGPAPLQPTTEKLKSVGRAVDVSTGGEIGVDWGNVGSPATTQNLSGTTVKTATDVETDTADIQTRLPAALSSGNMKCDVLALSGDTTAADNAEAFFDGTGYAGTNNVIPLVTVTTTATNLTNLPTIPTNWLTAAGTAADFSTELRTAINGGDYALNTDAGGSIRIVDGTGAGEINTSSGNVTLADSSLTTAKLGTFALAKTTNITGFNDLSAAQVNAEADTALSDVGLTTTITGRMDAATSTRATPAQVNTEVLDVLNVDTFAEPAQGTPDATASLVAKIGFIYKAWRNRSTQTSSQYSLYNDDAATIDHKSTVSDNGTTFDRGEVATGP